MIPRMLHRALREAQIKREVEPLIGFVPSMLLGALGTAAVDRRSPRGCRSAASTASS